MPAGVTSGQRGIYHTTQETDKRIDAYLERQEASGKPERSSYNSKVNLPKRVQNAPSNDETQY